MHISTITWHWPQWALLIWTMGSLAHVSAHHGKPRVEKDGEPERYNAFMGIIRTATLIFILTAGGFFA